MPDRRRTLLDRLVHRDGVTPEKVGQRNDGFFAAGSALVDLVLAAPLQAIRLLLGPFPWEVRGTLMVVVMIESWAYLALAVPVLFRIRPLLSRPEVLLDLFALVALAIAFGLGSANYGTSMRHRAKLVGLLIVLFAGCRETRRTPRARRATTRKRAQANG